MLDICFGDSECGMLKHALRKSKDGVSFTFRGLEIGKIAPNDFYLGRREWIDRFFAVCSAKERSQILAEDIKRFEAIIQAAKRDKVLRIWIASSPCSKSGYYHLIHSLQGINCPILVVELPADFSNYRSGDNTYDHSRGEVDVSLIDKGVFLQRELKLEERADIALKWEKLAKENSNLRLNINGELSSVSEDYLDEEIMRYAPNGDFQMITLIAAMLNNSRHGISDCFIAERIEALISAKKLCTVKRASTSKDYYAKTILRRAKQIELKDLNFDVILSQDEFESGLGDFINDEK